MGRRRISFCIRKMPCAVSFVFPLFTRRRSVSLSETQINQISNIDEDVVTTEYLLHVVYPGNLPELITMYIAIPDRGIPDGGVSPSHEPALQILKKVVVNPFSPGTCARKA